jgi:subtilase family serine protease
MVLIRNIARILLPLALLVMTGGCGVKVNYSFSGVSVSPEVKTFSVSNFQNRASLVQPGLSQKLTDALMDMCQAQTNLKMVTSSGDVSFEGDITDYRTQPLTVSGDEQAATNRFSISVRVRFVNTVDTDLSYEQTFTRYQDYDSALDLSAVEVQLAEEISKMLIEDIFNKAFVNW